jgi:hypothetical protein
MSSERDFEEDETALMAATGSNSEKTVSMLLEHGALPDETDADGNTALICAAAHGFANILRLLLDNGAQVDKTNDDGVTALMCAARYGQKECILLLLERGADPEKMCDGKTARDFAGEMQNWETQQLLDEIVARKIAEKKAQALHVDVAGKQKRLNRLAGKKPGMP